jgi:hypothetical protein
MSMSMNMSLTGGGGMVSLHQPFSLAASAMSHDLHQQQAAVAALLPLQKQQATMWLPPTVPFFGADGPLQAQFQQNRMLQAQLLTAAYEQSRLAVGAPGEQSRLAVGAHGGYYGGRMDGEGSSQFPGFYP